MKGTMDIGSFPELLDWIGETQDDSILAADLEALKDALPLIVEARYVGNDDLEQAIQSIGFTVCSLSRLQNAFKARLWES